MELASQEEREKNLDWSIGVKLGSDVEVTNDYWALDRVTFDRQFIHMERFVSSLAIVAVQVDKPCPWVRELCTCIFRQSFFRIFINI